jgi:hypothetical protein
VLVWLSVPVLTAPGIRAVVDAGANTAGAGTEEGTQKAISGESLVLPFPEAA